MTMEQEDNQLKTPRVKRDISLKIKDNKITIYNFNQIGFYEKIKNKYVGRVYGTDFTVKHFKEIKAIAESVIAKEKNR